MLSTIILIISLSSAKLYPYITNDKPIYQPNERLFASVIYYDPSTHSIVPCDNIIKDTYDEDNNQIHWEIKDSREISIAEGNTHSC